MHRLRHGACARRPHRRPGPPARARGAGARPAPWNRRPGARKHRDGGDPWGLVHHSDHGSQYLSIAHAGRLVDEGTGRLGRKPWAPPCAGAAAEALNKPLQARGPFWRDGPWKDRDDPRGRNRPLGELVQPHPTPPDQRRRPVTRRRRTPLPSKPHHHHGITNPPQNPGRSTPEQTDEPHLTTNGGSGAGINVATRQGRARSRITPAPPAPSRRSRPIPGSS